MFNQYSVTTEPQGLPHAHERTRVGRIFIVVGRVACTCSALDCFCAARAWAGCARSGSLLHHWNIPWATVAAAKLPRDGGSMMFGDALHSPSRAMLRLLSRASLFPLSSIYTTSLSSATSAAGMEHLIRSAGESTWLLRSACPSPEAGAEPPGFSDPWQPRSANSYG